MQQVDTNQLIPKASTVFNRIILFFGSHRILTPQPDQSPRPDRILSNIDWPDSDCEPPYCERDNQPVSGGYNEAYIVQHWTSYHLR
jgi:hypothetical protein